MNSIEFWKADILFYSRQQTAKSSLVFEELVAFASRKWIVE